MNQLMTKKDYLSAEELIEHLENLVRKIRGHEVGFSATLSREENSSIRMQHPFRAYLVGHTDYTIEIKWMESLK